MYLWSQISFLRLTGGIFYFIDLFLFLSKYLALEYAKRKVVINFRIPVLGQDNLATIMPVLTVCSIILHLSMPVVLLPYLALEEDAIVKSDSILYLALVNASVEGIISLRLPKFGWLIIFQLRYAIVRGRVHYLALKDTSVKWFFIFTLHLSMPVLSLTTGSPATWIV